MDNNFRPIYDHELTLKLVKQYSQNPYGYDPKFIDELEKHAEAYGVPFGRDPQEYEFSLARGIKQASEGFFSGMTTIKVGKETANEYERIMRNLGHLAGFAGILPLSKPLNLLGKITKSKAILNTAKGLKTSKLNKASVPMIAADVATDMIASPIVKNVTKKVLGKRGDITQGIGKFAYDDTVRDILHGAFHLGVASSISTWQDGVDVMMQSFVGGLEAGAAFRVMGNFINTGNPKGDKMLQGLAGSLYQGLPATEAGATTPEQVYEYVLGAYFGYNESPARAKLTRKFIAKMFEKGEMDKPVPEPSKVEGYKDLSPEVQKMVDQRAIDIASTPEHQLRMAGMIVQDFMKRGEEFPKEKIEYPEGFKEAGFTKEGEPLVKPEKLKEEKVKEEDQSHLEDNRGAEDSDVGTTVNVEPIGLRAVNYVERTLRDFLDNKDIHKTPYERLQAKTKIAEASWEKIKELTKETKENKSEEFLDWFQKENDKAVLSADDKAYMRQYFTERIHNEPTQFLVYDAATNQVTELDHYNPVTAGGNRKGIRQPKTIFHLKYEEATGEKRLNPLMILDTVSINRGEGVKEVDLFRFRDDFYYEGKYSKNMSEKEANEYADASFGAHMKEISKQLYGKNLYYFGGRGDAERAYFMKIHPFVTKETNIAPDFNMNKFYDDVVKSFSPKDRTAHSKDIEIFEKAYEGTDFGKPLKDVYKEMFVSNVLYDMGINGMTAGRDGYNIADFKRMTKKGYISGPIAFNKRQQIWTATGWAGDNKFIESRVKDLDNGHYKYVITDDADVIVNLNSKLKDYTEITDGAIIIRDDLVDAMNADWGMPESGQNKSFIVAPNAKNGAFLGKYMFHAAGAEQTASMKKKGLHFIVYDSAVKQKGSRVPTKVTWSNGELKYNGRFDPTNSYSDIKPEHVKGSFSEKNTSHMMDNQRIPKQLLSNLSAYIFSTEKSRTSIDDKKSIDAAKETQKEIDNFLDEIMGGAYRGNKEANEILEKYESFPTKENLAEVIKNIDGLGMQEIVRAMTKTNYEALNHAIYKHILKINNELLEEGLAEGEITKAQKEKYSTDIREFNSFMDRMLSITSEIAEKNPSLSSPILYHKFVRDFRMQAVRNYIVNRIAKPKIDNSLSARMRPVDAHLEAYLKEGKGDFNKEHAKAFFKESNTADRYFFLDDTFKDFTIKTDLVKGGRINLYDFWKMTQGDHPHFTGDKLKEAIETLNALGVRVPMDSMSGAHKLIFGGFTGRKGHGVLIHPRIMRALGGADLDGDKAFMFFGGRRANGEGYGMKQSWMDIYDKQKEEFVSYRNKKTGKVIGGLEYKRLRHATGLKGGKLTFEADKWEPFISDNKDSVIRHGDNKGKTYREVLTLKEAGGMKNNKALQDMLRSKSWYYSPYWRPQISQNASKGRQMLGPAVVNRSVINATRAAMLGSPEIMKDGFEYKVSIGRQEMDVIIKPRTDLESSELLREMGRATVALGSDPLDELGLNRGAFLSEMFKAAFDVQAVVNNRHLKGVDSIVKYLDGDTSWMTSKMSPFRMMKDINSAYYGRNWGAGRRYYIEEIKAMGKGFEAFKDGNGESLTNTMLPKLAQLLDPINWSDNIFKRVDVKKFEALYDQYSKINKNPKLQEILERYSFSVKKSPLGPDGKSLDNTLDFVYWRQLWLPHKREFLANLNDADWANLVENNSALSKKKNQKVWGKEDGRWKLLNERTVKELTPIERLKYLEKLVTQAEDFMVNDATDMASFILLDKYSKNVDLDRAKLIAQFANGIKRMSWLQLYKRRNTDNSEVIEDGKSTMYEQLSDEIAKQVRSADTSQKSAALDQGKIDRLIRKFKIEYKLNNAEIKFLEHSLLSSWNKGNIEAIEKLQQIPNKSDAESQALDILQREALGTRTGKVGLMSKEVSDASVKEFIQEYSKLFSNFRTVEKKETIDRVEKEAKESTEGKNEEGLVVQEPPVMSGLKGIIMKGKLPKEEQKVMTELLDHLNYYHDSIGNQINLITRGILNKDLNAMNLQDYKTLNRYFEGLRYGRWGKAGPDAPMIKKIYHYLFPRAVNEELMKHNFELLKEKGQFMMRDGTLTEGKIAKPTHVLTMLQEKIGVTGEYSTQIYEMESDKLKKELLFLEQIEDQVPLHQLAIANREVRLAKHLDAQVYKGFLSKEEAEQHKKTYAKTLEDTRKLYSKEDYINKIYNVRIPDKSGKTTTKRMTGQEVIDAIDKIYTQKATDLQELIRGKDGGWEKTLSKYIVGWHSGQEGEPNAMPIIDIDRFVADVNKNLSAGRGEAIDVNKKANPMYYGMDGLRRVAYSLMVQTAKKSKIKDMELIKRLESYKIENTKFLPAEAYWPHMMFDRAKANKALVAGAKKISEDTSLTKEEKSRKIQNLQLKSRMLTGEWIDADIIDWNLYDTAMSEMAQKKRGEGYEWYNKTLQSGNMFHRSSHIEGYSLDKEVYDAYLKNVVGTYYRQLNQIMSRQQINEFDARYRKKWGDKLTDAWSNYFKLYAQDSMGYPSTIPEHVLSSKEMNLKGTLYAKWADDNVRDRLNKIGRKLGIIKKDEKLPEDLQGIDLQTVRHWSNLEAKYEMAALLAHPKSMFTNIFGGQMHTIQSTGLTNWRTGRDIGWLKANINPGKDRLGNEWNSKAELEKWVTSHGVIPELMEYEYALGSDAKKGNFKKFFDEAMDEIKANPSLKDSRLKELATKHKITDSMFNKAGWFMRSSERILRRDAFMAHYVQAWKRFGGNIENMDHPFLIEMAKKGVRATQFMYSAPYRPAFARTALGKVMTRFQLWSWNSLRFRRDVIEEAALRGFRQGTPEFQRFKRMMQTDLMMMALGNVFMYSFFDLGLPAPYNWLQDTADWMFGDERERDRAFFGAWPKHVAPLQLVTPPIARLPLSAFTAWVEDDWSRILDYQIYTMFPFGRILKDVAPFAPHNVIDNPMSAVDKLTGFPFMKLPKVLKEDEAEHPYPRGWK